MALLLIKRQASPSGTPVPDKRGGKPSPRLISGRKLELVHEHIQALPVTAGHYSRTTTPHTRYLEDVTSITELYENYLNWLNQYRNYELKVSNHFYHTVFTWVHCCRPMYYYRFSFHTGLIIKVIEQLRRIFLCITRGRRTNSARGREANRQCEREGGKQAVREGGRQAGSARGREADPFQNL